MPFTPEQYQQAINTYNGVPDLLTQPTVPGEQPVMDVAPLADVPAVGAPVASAAPAQPIEAQPPVAVPVAPAPLPAAQPAASKPPTFDQYIANYEQAAKHEADVVRQSGELEAQKLEEEGKLAQAQADEIAVQQAEAKKLQDEYLKTNKETVQEFKDLNRQAENMRAVDSRTTGQKVMGTIAMALGSVADGFARMGGNNATDYAGEVQGQIQGQIDRDVARQKEAIQDKKKAAANRLTELGLAQNFFGDSMDALKFAESQITLKYAAQLKAVAGKTSNEAARNAAEVAAAGLETKANGTIAQLIERRDEQKMRSRLAGGPKAGGAGGKSGTMNAQDLLRKLDAGEPMTKQELDYALKLDAGRDRDAAAQAKKDAAEAKSGGKGDNETLIPGYEPVDASARPLAPGDVHKAREIAAGVAGVRSAGNRLAGLYADIEKAEASGDSQKADELRSRYYAAGGQFLVQKSLAGGQGVINESDARRDAQEGAVPPPPGAPASFGAKFTQLYKGVSPSAAGIRALAADITSDGESKLGVYNLRPKGKSDPSTTLPAGSTDIATPDVKIRVRNLETGVIGTIPANKLDAALKSGKFQRE